VEIETTGRPVSLETAFAVSIAKPPPSAINPSALPAARRGFHARDLGLRARRESDRARAPERGASVRLLIAADARSTARRGG
jgi:hypothetical protein